MSKLENELLKELLKTRWETDGGSLVCSGEDGSGIIICDTWAGYNLTRKQAEVIAKHIADIHNKTVKA